MPPPAPVETTRLVTGLQIVQGYGNGGFRIAGHFHEGSCLVFSDRVVAWAVQSADAVTADSLAAVDAEAGHILIIGCGPRFVPPPATLIAAMRARGISVEWMDTGAACRTLNVLAAEGRAVAAALIAID